MTSDRRGGVGSRKNLRVLFTTRNVGWVGGVQLFIRDLARGLMARGHEPMVYCASYGRELEHVRAWAVPVIDDLSQLSVTPDLIHGNDSFGLVTAMMHFSETPAIFFSHAWDIKSAVPPKLSRILRYVGVDETCYDRLVKENGIPLDKASIILNSVDTSRFRPRGPLPEKPRRALLFGNVVRFNEYEKRIREVCEKRGIELDAVGAGFGKTIEHPEQILGDYDVVFAKGRCALEAMAVGCAVVIQEDARIGGMITPAMFDKYRLWNFGWRALESELTTDLVESNLDLYDSANAAEVSNRIRSEASLDGAVDQIEELYGEVIREYGEYPRDPRADLREFAAHFQLIDSRARSKVEPPGWIEKWPRLRNAVRRFRQTFGLYR